jgi:uncharacterized integral membrane protein
VSKFGIVAPGYGRILHCDDEVLKSWYPLAILAVAKAKLFLTGENRMPDVNTGGSGLNSTSMPTPVPIARNAANWTILVGAFFGLITLLALFAFAYLASTNSQLCSSFQFQLLAGGFALGAALAGGFIGGGAGAQGKSGSTGFSLVFGLTGGAALLVVTLVVFSIFAPKGCDVLGSEQMRNQLAETQVNLSKTSSSLESVRGDLAAMTSQKDAATFANATARAEIKRLVAAIKDAFPDAGKLSATVSTIPNLVTQSCSGGPHGTDPAHASEIRSISADAAARIVSAQAAIANIVASVPAELRN